MANMDFMFDWEAEGDRFSFEDSDRFDEDSICSWISEPESLCNNWRGWKKQNGGTVTQVASTSSKDGLTSLVELASQTVACHIPFEVIEHFYPPVPEHLQLRIAFLSFPELEEDIRLYSCLANGSADEFQKGEHLFKAKAVKDALQIGFHLSATVIPPQTVAQPKGNFNVAVVFDKRKISSCSCTCNSTASWCAHVVALCLFRIHQASSVILRAPVSESLSRLHRDQLQKFAQYLITELPQQILPTAQRLLDELLSSQQSAINTVCGAPDPTAGPSASEHTKWCLDEANLHENIKRTLVKFSQPTAMVYSDVNFLSSTAPPAAAEWQSLLRPLRGREPEGMWNLLSIVREMFRRHDSNAVPLLEILTEEIMCYDTILSWWFTTKVTTSHNNQGISNRGNNSVQAASQHAAMSLCDEVVALWRLAALNPALSPIQRDDLATQLKDWHIKTIDKVRNFRNSHVGNQAGQPIKKQDIEVFVGFKPSVEACYLDWSEYPIPGVTYVDKYKKKFVIDHHKVTTLSSTFHNMDRHRNLSGSVLKQKTVLQPQVVVVDPQNDGGCSSSSEGFCENERPEATFSRDSDSSFTEEDGLSRSKASKQSASETVSKLKLKDRNIPVGVSISDQEPIGACAKAGEEADSDSSVPGAVGYNKAVSALKAEKWQESTNSSDEYQVYFYDTKAKLGDLAAEKKKKDEPNYLAGLKKIELKQDILFARAEALHAHGHTKEACKLAKQLAEEMLSNPPDLSNEPLSSTASKGKKKKAQHTVSSQAISTLTKSSFLCSVLSEDTECHHLAFKVGMFGLEMPRPPASSKGLEVKLANQEQELVILLKKIPLGSSELNVLRDRAEQLRDGKLRSRGEALLPLVLASFVFDSLCQPAQPVYGTANRPPSRSVGRQHLDDLGFHAAVAALGLKANVSEAEHPLLCEGTRRQRGDLAIAMLVHYKDDQIKLQKIMEKLLDKDVHQLYKGPTLNSYLPSGKTGAAPQVKHTDRTAGTGAEGVRQNNVPATQAVPSHNACGTESGAAAVPSTSSQPDNWQERGRDNLDYLNLEQKFMTMHLNNIAAGSASARPKTSLVNKYQTNKDTDSSAVEEECDGAEYKAWEEKFRCTNLKTFKKHSVGMASIDSSAPETTSSDNSPTLVRRNWAKHQGPGSDSGSSGKSSDSIGSSSSDNKRAKAAAICRDNESPPGPYQGLRYPVDSRSSTPNMKLGRYKGKNRAMPTIPNQPSEASAHFMFELAKTVLGKAGGNSATSLFTQATANNNHSGPHRQLHLCAFQIGLYALGLHNCVSPNWLSRTYSSHVSWITGQAMEVGAPAIKILIDTWEGHLTPPEAAAMADRASRGRDPNMVRAAADLALSCLPHAHALNPNEIQRALIQCREQSREKLEQACLAVESAAKGGGVYPEVLFDVARRWYELYEESVGTASAEAAPVPAAAASPVLVAVQPQANQQATPQVAQVPVMQPGPERTSPPMIPVVAIQQVPPATQQHQVGSVAATVSYSIQAQQGAQPQQQVAHHPAYIAPYSYVQQIPTFGHHYTQPHIPLNTHNMHPAYVTTHPYQNQTQFNNIAHVQNVHPNTTLYHPNVAHLRGVAPQVQLFTNHNGQVASIPQNGQVVNVAQPMDAAAATLAGGQAVVMSQVPEQPHPHNSTQMNYLMAAYRVGMLALETLARRVHDDRPQTKFARNPPYGEDVKWLLSIGMKLGISCLQQFCGSITNSVMSPFVIQDIAIEIAHYLARNNPAQVTQQLRSPLLNTLVQKCLQMFIQCAHQRLHHISQAEYDEFVTIICSARNAFCMTPGGMVQFNELLTNLRRSKSCKKDLWQRIVNGLATGGM